MISGLPGPGNPVVYVIHFTPRLGHAGHYLGWTDDLVARMKEHHSGNGSKLVARAIEAGCEIALVRWWPGTRALEASFKRHGGPSPKSRKGRHGARTSIAKYCPRCDARARFHKPIDGGWIEETEAP